MKPGLLLITGLGLATMVVGCVGPHQDEPRPTARVPVIEDEAMLAAQPAGASALVFDPPVAMGSPQLDLSRDGREPEAFWGFDGGVTTFYYLRNEDRQIDPSWNGIDRRAVTERFGVTFR